ncbi:MAG: Acid stress protein IbaG [Myxococcota bacterium]|nr:Acid stress protein IbaG [Myxococcota bacterium]
MNAAEVKRLIEQALPGATVRVEDPMNDGAHFSVLVVSPGFEGKTLVQQHRMVTGPLKQQLDSNGIHAMQLKTLTPAEWAAAGAN